MVFRSRLELRGVRLRGARASMDGGMGDEEGCLDRCDAHGLWLWGRSGVRFNGGTPLHFALSAEMKAYRSRIETPAGRPVLIEIASPTWCRAGEPADQGVRLDRVVLSPAP